MKITPLRPAPIDGAPADLQALVAACRAFPHEQTPRLMILDYCQEHTEYLGRQSATCWRNTRTSPPAGSA